MGRQRRGARCDCLTRVRFMCRSIPFRKMYGLGNDFIVLDARKDPTVGVHECLQGSSDCVPCACHMHDVGDAQRAVAHTSIDAVQLCVTSGCGADGSAFVGQISSASEPKRATALTDRKVGIGCDQLIILETSKDALCTMRIINADGSEVGACGNATRCVGGLLFEEDSSVEVATIRTKAGLLKCYKGASPDMITVDMGEPGLEWQQVPVSKDCDTLNCGTNCEGPGLTNCAVCSMGNPHATFFVDDCESVPLDTIGHDLEHHSFFPERCNVSVVTVAQDKKSIRMRVWERGTGITQACGTGACGTAVNAIRRGYIGKEQNYTVEVQMDGGSLTITYAPPGSGEKNEGRVLMTGRYDHAFSGQIPASLWV